MDVRARTAGALVTIAAVLIGLAGARPAAAAGMPVDQVKKIMELTKDRWVAFRAYGGRQWIYFTHLVVYRCAIGEVRYSIDGNGLDQRFPLPKCDPQRPLSVDPDHKVALTFAPGHAKTVTVQIVFGDGSESPAHSYKPCDNAGDRTCAVPVD